MPRKSRRQVQLKPEIGQRRAQRRRKNLLIWGGAGILFIAAITFLIIRQIPPSVEGEESFADQGSGTTRHLSDVSEPHLAYNSNPPTSGFHVGNNSASWGVSKEPIPDELTVHNLEHGGIVIHYRQDLDPAQVQQLSDLTTELRKRNPCVVLVPRPADKLDVPVAAAAWTYLLKLQTIDTARLTEFFEAHVGRGVEPECKRL